MPYLLRDTQTTVGGDVMQVYLSTLSEIPYVELYGGERYTESWGYDANECTRTVACLWKDREKLRRDFVGDSFWFPGNSVGGQVTNMARDIPERHPSYDYMFVTGVENVRGFGVPTADQTELAKALSAIYNVTGMNDGSLPSTTDDEDYGPAYAIAVMVVKYAGVKWSVLSDADVPTTNEEGEVARFVQRVQGFSVENLNLPGIAFEFVSGTGSRQIPQGPVKLFPTQQVSHIWKWIPAVGLDFDKLNTAQGKVNSIAFDYVYGDDTALYEPGTLLLMNVELRDVNTPFGVNPSSNGGLPTHYDVVFNYNHRKTGWNNFYQRSSNDFIEISTDGATHAYGAGEGDKHVYDDTDFYELYKLVD